MSNELYEAISRGSLAEVKNYVENKKVAINQLNEEGRSPLEVSIIKGKLDIFCYFLEKKAKVCLGEVSAVDWVRDIAPPELKKAFITKFLELPKSELALSPAKQKSLAVIAGKMKPEEIERSDKAALRAFAGCLFYFDEPALLDSFEFGTDVFYGCSEEGLTPEWVLAVNQQWELLETWLKKKAWRVNLNAMPVNEQNRYRGVTLAWLLAHGEQWNLLGELFEKNAWKVDLDAAPVNEQNRYRGVTLAWTLAVGKQSTLLKKLSENSYGLLNLNAGPTHDQHPDNGVTLAWLLSAYSHWAFLEKLLKNSSDPVDLNAAPVDDQHKGKGITLAWLLARGEQWNLLGELFEKNAWKVDLDAAPLGDKYKDKGITLAWLLAVDERDLLRSLLEKNAWKVDLDAAPAHNKNPNKNLKFSDLLIQEKQFSLVFEILEKNSSLSVDAVIGYLQKYDQEIQCESVVIQSLLSKLTEETLILLLGELSEGNLKDNARIALATQWIRKFGAMLAVNEGRESATEALKGVIGKIFDLLREIPKESKCCKDRADILGNFLANQIVPYAENKSLQDYVLTELEKKFEKLPVLEKNLESVSMLRLYTWDFLTISGNRTATLNLMAASLPKQTVSNAPTDDNSSANGSQSVFFGLGKRAPLANEPGSDGHEDKKIRLDPSVNL
jgi:hypothetical protein